MDKIETIKKMLNICPYSGKIWYLLGLEYKEQHLCKEAISAFSEALTHLESADRHLAYYELSTLSNQKNALHITGAFHQSEHIPVQKPSLLLDQLAGHESLKRNLQKNIIQPFLKHSHLNILKKKACHTLLLYGPPGCGKHKIAEAIAGECHASFISITASDHISPYQEMNKENLQAIFKNARDNTPCVLYFDKIDDICFQSTNSISNTATLVKKQLLAEIKRVESGNEQILFIPSTSNPWNVEPELKQLARSELSLFVAPPDFNARCRLFAQKLDSRFTDAIAFEQLAAKTEFCTETDIDAIVELAAEYVIMDFFETTKERPICTEDLLQAIAVTTPSALEWIKTVKNFIQYTNLTGFYNDVENYIDKYQKLL